MEANYGILSVIPAFIVIGLALYSKKTIISLLIRHIRWRNDFERLEPPRCGGLFL